MQMLPFIAITVLLLTSWYLVSKRRKPAPVPQSMTEATVPKARPPASEDRARALCADHGFQDAGEKHPWDVRKMPCTEGERFFARPPEDSSELWPSRCRACSHRLFDLYLGRKPSPHFPNQPTCLDLVGTVCTGCGNFWVDDGVDIEEWDTPFIRKLKEGTRQFITRFPGRLAA